MREVRFHTADEGSQWGILWIIHSPDGDASSYPSVGDLIEWAGSVYQVTGRTWAYENTMSQPDVLRIYLSRLGPISSDDPSTSGR